MSNTSLSHGDDHDERIGADPSAVRRGYEEDLSNISGGIWSVPLAVVAFIALGISVAAGSFWYFSNREMEPGTDMQAAARSEAKLNDRMSRLGRAGQGSELTEQPRLEGLRIREGDGFMTSRPVISAKVAPLANSPEYHAEDLRAYKQPLLNNNGWVEKDKVARISIDDAMKLALQGHLFPVRKDPVTPLDSVQRATSANAGRGELPKTTAPAPKPKDDHGH